MQRWGEVQRRRGVGLKRELVCLHRGKVTKDCGVRVLRKGKTVFVGVLDSLRRIKEDVKEVNAGLECGIGVDDFNEWEEGDVIETFNSIQKRRTLEEASVTMAAAFKEAGIEM